AGQRGTLTKTVTIAAGSSSGQLFADFGFSPTNPKAGNTLFFDATPSSGGVVTWTWDFGDGSAPGSGQKPSHVYATAASWVVRLTITNSSGQTATTTKTVSVAP